MTIITSEIRKCGHRYVKYCEIVQKTFVLSSFIEIGYEIVKKIHV